MNTEKEYQLIKQVIPILQDAKNPFVKTGDYKKVKEWHINQLNQIKDLKVRKFILNLNLRPELPLPEEIQMKIKRTAVNTELKSLMTKTKYKKFVINEYRLRKNDLVEMLIQYKYQSKGVLKNDIYTCDMFNHVEIYKKDALRNLLELNNVEYKKSWTINKLLKLVMAL